jgi:site-specific recombinase XerD
MVMKEIDIQNFEKRCLKERSKIENSRMSKRNKELILDYDKICILEALKFATRSNILQLLRHFAEDYMSVDFDKASIRDLREAILKLEEKPYSAYHKQSHKATLKKFYKWLYYGDNYKAKLDYPEICSWINASIKKKDMKIIKASDLLSEEEVKKLIDFAGNARDKAIISTLYELGARVSELGNRLIRDVVRDEYGYIIDLNGKTGRRSPRIIMSAPYLTAWLNTHPLRENPDSPLWIALSGHTRYQHITYHTILDMIHTTMKRSGMKKRVYPHLFRHSRATHCLANGWMNEAQCKVYFGWTPDSAMLSRYAHLTCEDANKAVLRMNGIETGQRKDSVLKTKQCPNCKMINEPGAKFCNKCTSILDVKTATEIDQTRKTADEKLTLVLTAHPEIVNQIIALMSKT